MVTLKCGCIICGNDTEIEVSKRIREELGKGILYVCIECGRKTDAFLKLTEEQSILVGELKGVL